MSAEPPSPAGEHEPAASEAVAGAPEPHPGETTTVASPSAELAQHSASGVMWLTVQKWAIRLFGFLTIALLTRLLNPEDFGTLAAASTVLPFFYLLADLGFAAYIVQVPETNQRMLSTANWFSVGAGVVLCGALVLAAPLFGLVFGSEDVVPVLRVLALSVLLTAGGSVPMALLRRSMRFSTIAKQGATAALVAQGVAIGLAVGGLGVWALVGQTLTAPLVTMVLSWITVRWRPSLMFSRDVLSTMARFGGQVLGVEFIAMLRAWGEAAVISSVLGIVSLGYMNIAQRLVQVVQDLTGSAIVPVSTVAFAKIREARERLRVAYLRALRMTYAALSMPLTFVAVSAPLLIPIIFGNGWQESYPVARVLAIAGILSVGAWLDHGLYYGMGKPGVWFVYAVITDAVTFATTVVTARWGLVAIATGFLAVALVATVTRWFLVARLLHTRPATIAGPSAYLLVVMVTSGGAGMLTMMVSQAMPSWLSVILIGLTVAIVHLGMTLWLARDAVLDALKLVGGTGLGGRLPFMRRFVEAGGAVASEVEENSLRD